MEGNTNNGLKRRLGVFQSTVINMIDMVGIGPFVVLPLVIDMMGGPHFLWAWLAGALISFLDAMVWSELGAAYPLAGGSYNFLREAYNPGRAGKLFSFLYVFQTMIQAPLVVASGAIGFAQYFSFLVPLSPLEKKAISGVLVILLTILLYRKIETLGKIGVLLWAGVIATLLWIIAGGVLHGNFAQPIREMMDGPAISSIFFVALGHASVKTIYSYLGYYNVCHLGAEIKDPVKTIPRSMFLSIAGIAILYMAMNISVVSVIPWQEARHSEYIVSIFVERLYGSNAARFATVMILWVAFASLFAVMLGYSRVPYAAALKGEFFKAFAQVHPEKDFPTVSLLVLGSLAFVFSLLFRLSEVITAILAMRILVQFVGQAIGLILLHRKKRNLPFRMPLYPLPVLLVIGIWLFILFSTGPSFILSGLAVTAIGTCSYLVISYRKKQWPF